MDRFKQAIAGQATGSARLYSGSGEAGSNQVGEGESLSSKIYYVRIYISSMSLTVSGLC